MNNPTNWEDFTHIFSLKISDTKERYFQISNTAFNHPDWPQAAEKIYKSVEKQLKAFTEKVKDDNGTE